jgi:hypothetical protein
LGLTGLTLPAIHAANAEGRKARAALKSDDRGAAERHFAIAGALLRNARDHQRLVNADAARRRRGGEITAAKTREARANDPDVKRILRLAKRYATSDELPRLHKTAVAYILKQTGFSRGKVLRALSPPK